MAAGPLGADLFAYLVDTLYSVPAPDRGRSRWVMSAEWVGEIRRMADARGFRLWEPQPSPEYLLGLPYEVREDGGVPHLEPV